MNNLKTLSEEIHSEALGHIMPFWLRLVDEEYGSFYGQVQYNIETDKRGDKGGIATARLLWSFSAAYHAFGQSSYLDAAIHVYRFLTDKVLDHEMGGLYWMLNHKGEVIDDRKHVYAQAFGVYAFSEYYKITNEPASLRHAIMLFHLIQDVGYDEALGVYKEEFTRDWEPVANEMLSENGVTAEATTNTILHVLEAYTNLYKVWPDKTVKEALMNILDIFKNKIYKQSSKFLKVFYDKAYNEIIDMQSYGHDIEASWLLDQAIKVLGLSDISYHQMVVDIADNIYKKGISPDCSVITECEKGVDLDDRVWWVQAEAMVGFMNAYQRTGEKKYRDLLFGIWDYTKETMIDKRPGGEWYWCVSSEGTPIEEPIVEPWKTPYHNIRFCIEMIERIKAYDS